MFTPSKYQSAIFNFVKNGMGNAIIKACAGSGKTTTILKALNFCQGNVLFLAFGKAIADTLQKRVPSNVACSTLHSAGFAMLRQGRYVKLDNKKIDYIMNNYAPLQYLSTIKGKEAVDLFNDRNIVKRLVSLIKANLTDYTNVQNIQDLADYYGIDDYQSKHADMIKYVIETNNRQINIIDFDDMVYLPVILKLTNKTKYDFIFVDECQDLNKAQLELVLMLTNATGRVIAVGDPMQSIYAFRSADVTAMEKMKSALNAQEFPLSVCYRCPSSIIKLAKEIVPEIEQSENAIEGTIKNISIENFLNTLLKENDKDTLVLSRTNAELISNALKLIAQGTKAIIKGKNIGEGLISLVNKMKADNIGMLELNLTEWKNKEIEKLEKRRASESAINIIQDKFDSLMIIIQQSKDIDDVIIHLDNLFNNDSLHGYVFASIHQAKGQEAKNVYILAPHKLPLSWRNQKEWEKDQEMNIKYVAITRTLENLTWVNNPN